MIILVLNFISFFHIRRVLRIDKNYAQLRDFFATLWPGLGELERKEYRERSKFKLIVYNFLVPEATNRG